MSIKDFLNKWKKEVNMSTDNTMISSIGASYNSVLSTVSAPQPLPSSIVAPSTYITGVVSGGGGAAYAGGGGGPGGVGAVVPNTWSFVGGGGAAGYLTSYAANYGIPQTDIMKLHNLTGKEIVRLTQEGKVI